MFWNDEFFIFEGREYFFLMNNQDNKPHGEDMGESLKPSGLASTGFNY